MISKLNPFLSYPGHDGPLRPWQRALMLAAWRLKLATPAWVRRWVPDPFYRDDAFFDLVRKVRYWALHPATAFPMWRSARRHKRQFNQLVKALEAGGYDAAPTTLNNGCTLQVEDLSAVMECVTFDASKIRLRTRRWSW
jgi:hypothetical protein